MDDDRPDYGQMAINNDNRETEFVNKSNEAEAYVGATGIKTAGDVEAAGIIADAKAGVAQAQGNAAMMKGIGSIASSALGAFGSPSWRWRWWFRRHGMEPCWRRYFSLQR